MTTSKALFLASSLTFASVALAQNQINTPEPVLLNTTEAIEVEGPVVKKFAQNIYHEQYFEDSVYYDYLSAFWTGYNMQTYTAADDCLDYTTLTLNMLREWDIIATQRSSLTELWDLFFLVAGTDANDAWYNCFLFGFDFYNTYAAKFTSFSDFGDVYLSFIFNMLQHSLNIRAQAENMVEAYDTHDTETFVKSLASILRNTLDFESYTLQAAPLVDGKMPDAEQMEAHREELFKRPQQTEQERKQEFQERLDAAKAKVDAKNLEYTKKFQERPGKVNILRAAHSKVQRKLQSPSVGVAEDYTWTSKDYVQAPLAVTIGALGALPQDTNGPECAENASRFRANYLDGFDFNNEDVLTAAYSYYVAGQYLDEVGVYCQQSVTSTLNASYWTQLATQFYILIPENLLYNAGYLWVDVINYLYYTPETVPEGDWGYFVMFLAGDFAIRLFYHDDTPQQVQN